MSKIVVSVEYEVKALAIEHARVRTVPKPWGIVDLRPWSNAREGGRAIGELWYERPGSAGPDTSLLLKLLFTSQPLSIQVHPDDAYAHSIGLQNGKTEAWYVLSATPEAKVALGLKRRLTPKQLRQAGEDGSITNLVVWQAVSQGDSIFVPAGTIHAIGAGLVIAEIQQRSDATFRLFDHGRQRELHIENAILVADAGPAEFRVIPTRLTDTRTLLISNTHFTFERICRQTPIGAWKRNKRPGFSSSMAELAPNRSMSSKATPFSRSRIASTCTSARWAWRVWWRTRGSGSFRICCSAPDSRTKRLRDGY